MKIHELIRRLESAAEKHGNINVGMTTVDRGHYSHVISVQVNKNKGDSLGVYPIVELEGQAIFIIR